MHDRFFNWLILEPLEVSEYRIMLLGWGVLLSCFPVYAHVIGWAIWIFYCGGLICCLSVIGSVITKMGRLLNNRFISNVVRALLLTGLAMMGHFSSVFYSDIDNGVFKLFALACSIMALPSILVCFKDFYCAQEKRKLLLETFTFKNVVSFVSATVAFLTVLISFIQVVLPLISANIK